MADENAGKERVNTVLVMNTTTKVLLITLGEVAVILGMAMAFIQSNIDKFQDWFPMGENAYFVPLILGFVVVFNMYYLMEKLADEQIGKIRDDY